jgi:hypothetical protein
VKTGRMKRKCMFNLCAHCKYRKKFMQVNKLKWDLILISVRGVTSAQIKTSDSYNKDRQREMNMERLN